MDHIFIFFLPLLLTAAKLNIQCLLNKQCITHWPQSDSWAWRNPKTLLDKNGIAQIYHKSWLKHNAHFQKYWVDVTRLKKRKRKRNMKKKKNLKHKKNDSFYDIFPKGFSKDKLIWVPGQTQALLLGRRSWDFWTDFGQQEGLFGRDGGRGVCLPGSLWIDEQLNGLMR